MEMTLDPATQQRVEQKVKDGRYANAAAVLSAAMDALEQQEIYEAAVADRRAKAAVGTAEAEQADLSSGEDYLAELERELEAQDNKDQKAT